ncbi:hydrogenase maturation protease [Oceanirhabdus sp. W0125-5]|uniref:hydrogenase maturation protease n=1 Tax=Oceanirhabdus sp. W0125-5 TaxID=2999116 RepID=UPI0022F33114|nr:hydrogenase maturation protease [Oceanirhabdus sp. W0125-5]WBW95813.1 hydrogenase maturation protease [Oceanirhabdus sp. W0125-5]
MKKQCIIGIGNILLRDDGIGVHLISELHKEKLRCDVDLIDGGTSTFDLLGYFLDNEKIIVVDSLKGGHEPGTIYRITPEELGTYIKSNSSLHDVQVFDIIKQANLMGADPEVIIIGVEPHEIFYDMELSQTLKNEMPNIIRIVKEEIESE